LNSAADVVDVTVGDDNLLELQLVLGEVTENPGDVIPRIDHDCLRGIGIRQNCAITLQQADWERLTQ
jgi:hypothetical protein